MENKRTISSDLTFIHKFIFPSLTIVLALYAIYLIVHYPEPTSLHEPGKIVIPLFLLVWFIPMSIHDAPMKRIELQSNHLIISNYWKSISVPVSEIETITENAGLNYHPIWIYFKHETVFGIKVMFMPHITFKLFGFSPHRKRVI